MARRNTLGLATLACVLAALWAWSSCERAPAKSLLAKTTGVKLSRRFALQDPMSPGRRVFTLEPRDPSFDGVRAKVLGDGAWVTARPDPAYRYERKPEERGGVDPCALSAAEHSPFGAWKFVSRKSYFAMPSAKVVRPDGSFDVMMIFHGHDVALTQLSQADVPIVLFGTTRGDYRAEYAGPEALGQLLGALESRVSDAAGRPAHADHIALAAWSGGYDAVSILLEQSDARDRVDAVVLLDGLHCSRDPERMPLMLGPFVAFAKRAAARKTFMFVSHSSVDTDGFASTTETMHYLANELGGRPLRVTGEDPLGLRLIELFNRGDFHLRGYAGGGKRDHCANLGLYPEVARALARRWKSKG